ncbi:MAG: flagellin [Candidatus Sericytochromatia bacterium]
MDGRPEAKIIPLDAHRGATRQNERLFEARLLLQRMLALSRLAAEREHTAAMRATLQERLDQLGLEVDRLADGSGFSVAALLDGGVSVGSTSEAQHAVSRLQEALQTISSPQADLGETGRAPSGHNRIIGRDMASEITRLSRSQIHHQPATALMAQARSLLGNMLRFPGRPSRR